MAALAAGLTFNELLLAMILGEYFLMYHLQGLVSVIAYKTGLYLRPFDSIQLWSGRIGIASLFVPIVNLGWYTIQAALYGHFIAQWYSTFPTQAKSLRDDAQCGYYGYLCSSRY